MTSLRCNRPANCAAEGFAVATAETAPAVEPMNAMAATAKSQETTISVTHIG
jgi:hypothetical protein